MSCGLPPPVSETLTFACNTPVTCGVNVTVIVQFAPAARLVPQLLISEKLLACNPVIPMLVIDTVELPMLVTVKLCGALDVPTGSLPRFRLVVEELMAVPLPVKATV